MSCERVMNKTTLKMPPQSEWYTHVFRDTETGANHAVITTKRHYKRKSRSRVVCGSLVLSMQRRVSSGTVISAVTCEKCLTVHRALEQLLEP